VVRAYESATILAQHLELGVTQVPDLSELDVGDWYGKSRSELKESAAYSQYLTDPSLFAPPNGESIRNLSGRVTRAIDHILRAQSGNTVLTVTHGDCIRAAICHYIGMPLKCIRSLQIDLASFSILETGPNSSRLLALNHPFCWPTETGVECAY
jgi:broad specificity phosphatase PhoE